MLYWNFLEGRSNYSVHSFFFETYFYNNESVESIPSLHKLKQLVSFLTLINKTYENRQTNFRSALPGDDNNWRTVHAIIRWHWKGFCTLPGLDPRRREDLDNDYLRRQSWCEISMHTDWEHRIRFKGQLVVETVALL